MDMAIIPALEPAFGEIILAVGAMGLLMFGAFAGQRATSTINGIAIALLAGALLVLFLEPGQRSTFSDAFILDDFARLMKGLVLLGSAVAIAMSVGYAKAERFERFEYPILIVIATVGMMMMISAGDLISMYLGLELQSLALYVVAAINRDSVRSTEAGLKFFVLGALSSGMLLYGASLVYGFTGQTSFEGISAAMLDSDRSLGLVFGLVFVLAGLAFKISAVPFHMWTPDVYEGAPTPVTAFFAGAPKLAAMALFLRVTVDGFQPLTVDWQQIVSFLAIASMLLGAFAGIGQRNIKRLMAYSSIGHMGYALIGLAAGSVAGVGGVVLYLIVYLVMTLATFACILAMRRGEETFEEIGELAGLWQSQPGVALALGALMFSLAGFPPLGGFFAKYLVFSAAVEAELTWLAVIGALSSVVSCFYYLRIVKIAFFDEPSGQFDRMPAELGAVLGVGALFILFFVFFIGPLGQVAEVAARSLF